ncbi:putative uncharacterized protein DDB_G0290521 [Ctenocephalides felis]|uniref:putative uncharacterized protein DDB_G0290521 n=1 Tax=Ctenocephalides felis TaxID=7515 RepID=UPI000E6E29E2|nr:putative uncharacterized protein DDB_G0290521 [Ctenocephalides felis]
MSVFVFWSPSSSQTQSGDQTDRKDKEPSPPIAPIWTPRSAQASPVVERKEFRPVSFESPTLPRRKTETPQTTPTAQPPWQNGATPTTAPTAPTFTTTPSSPIALPAPPPPPLPAPPSLSDNLNAAIDTRKLTSSWSAPVDLQDQDNKAPFTFQEKKDFFSSEKKTGLFTSSSGSNLQDKKNLFSSSSGSNLDKTFKSFSSGSGAGLAGLAGSTPVSESSYSKFPGSVEKELFTKKSEEFSKVIKEYKSTSRNSELLSEEKREERYSSSSGDPIPVRPVIDPVGSFGEVLASTGTGATKFGTDTGFSGTTTGISTSTSTNSTTNNVSAKLPRVQNPTITLLQKARESTPKCQEMPNSDFVLIYI